MSKVRDIYNAIDAFAPFKYAQGWDNSGVLIGNMDAEVSTAVITLDITDDVIETAEKSNANLIISHHPIIFDSLRSISSGDIAYKLISKGISVISAHTNLDASSLGPDAIASKLFDIKNGANLEMVADGFGIGVMGDIDSVSFDDFVHKIKRVFGCTNIKYYKNTDVISKIAFCCGGGSCYLNDAIAGASNVFITGDVKHSVWIEAVNKGISLVEVSHYNMEKCLIPHLCQRLSLDINDVNFIKCYGSISELIING